MSQAIIDATVANLNKTFTLIQCLDQETFTNRDCGPYYSSVGDHLRHILDIFNAILNGLAEGQVDLTDRVRGTELESNPALAVAYLQRIVHDLEGLRDFDPATPITVIDDLGLGKIAVPSTLGGGLSQAHSHAIHHYASIGYLLELQGKKIPEAAFGYNPTTPRTTES